MKRLFVTFAGVLVVFLQAPTLSAQSYDPTYVELAHIRIRSAANAFSAGKCMDINGGVVALNAAVIQYDCNSRPSQEFSIINNDGWNKISSDVDKSLCVGIPTNNPTANQLLQLVSCSEHIWGLRVDQWPSSNKIQFGLYASDPEVCIDVPSGSQANGIWLQTYFCNGGVNQAWDIYKW